MNETTRWAAFILVLLMRLASYALVIVGAYSSGYRHGHVWTIKAITDLQAEAGRQLGHWELLSTFREQGVAQTGGLSLLCLAGGILLAVLTSKLTEKMREEDEFD